MKYVTMYGSPDSWAPYLTKVASLIAAVSGSDQRVGASARAFARIYEAVSWRVRMSFEAVYSGR